MKWIIFFAILCLLTWFFELNQSNWLIGWLALWVLPGLYAIGGITLFVGIKEISRPFRDIIIFILGLIVFWYLGAISRQPIVLLY